MLENPLLNFEKEGNNLSNESAVAKRFSEEYWEKEQERTKALVKKQEVPFDTDAVFFFGMCISVCVYL